MLEQIERVEQILATHPFFAGMEKKHLNLLAERATYRTYRAGEFIFRQGEAAGHFYLLRRGKISVEVSRPEGGASVIQTHREGEVLGWPQLFPPYRWQFDARALELCRVVELDSNWIREACEEDHDLGYALMKRVANMMVERLQATRLQLLDVYGLFS